MSDSGASHLKTPAVSAPPHPSAPDQRRRICGYLVHPAADLMPEPTAEEFDRLVADIKESNITVPIILMDGPSGDVEILDGRSRARAWESLDGTKDNLNTKVVSRSIVPDPVAHVLTLNVHRRHLRPDQVAAIYVLANQMQVAEQQAKAAEAKVEGLRGGTDAPTGSRQSQAVAKRISQATRVGERTVKKVLKVQQVAPERLSEIAKGTTSANKVLRTVKPPKATKPNKEQQVPVTVPVAAPRPTKDPEMVDVVQLIEVAFALRAWQQLRSRHRDDQGGPGSQSAERVTARRERQERLGEIGTRFEDFMETPTPAHWAAVMAAVEPFRAEVQKMIADEEEEKQMQAFVDADSEVRRLDELDGSEPEYEEGAYEAAVERAKARYRDSRRS